MTMTLRDLLEHPIARTAIEPMLIECRTPAALQRQYARVMRAVINAADDNKEIRECEPRSIIRATARAVSWNLTIGETCFLIPRRERRTDPKPKLTALQGYRGKMALCQRHNIVTRFNAQPVYANEHYVPKQGTSPDIEHWPMLDEQDAGELVGAYAIAWRGRADRWVHQVSRKHVNALRNDLSQKWSSQKFELLDAIPWYAVKTAVHRLCQLLPIDDTLAWLLIDDSDDNYVHVHDDPSQLRLPAGFKGGLAETRPEDRVPYVSEVPAIVSAPVDDPYGLDAKTSTDALAIMAQAQLR